MKARVSTAFWDNSPCAGAVFEYSAEDNSGYLSSVFWGISGTMQRLAA